MIKLEAQNKGDGAGVKIEVDGCGNDLLEEGIAAIRSVIDLYAEVIHESKTVVCCAVLSALLAEIEGEHALADKEGTDLC